MDSTEELVKAYSKYLCWMENEFYNNCVVKEH